MTCRGTDIFENAEMAVTRRKVISSYP